MGAKVGESRLMRWQMGGFFFALSCERTGDGEVQ